MKKAHFILMFLAAFLSSCSVSEKEGDWDDNIKLSQKKVQFTASENSVVISAKSEGWWINEVSLNGNLAFEPTENSDGRFIINEEEFVVERISAKELYIEMSANTTGSERILNIGLQNGNYFDGVSVTQAAQ